MIALTGTTGKVGRRVAERLSTRGSSLLLVGRRPEEQPDLPDVPHRGPAAYDDAPAMTAALRGADTLLLVSGNLSGRRLHEHGTAMRAALEAGVTRIVYLSLMSAAPAATYLNARDHGETEALLASLDVRWTVLRAGFYASMLPGLADQDGTIRSPAGDGRVSAVTHDDVADVAAVVLEDDDRWDGLVLDVTGPEALDMSDVAARLEAWTGRPHRYLPESLDAARAWRRDLPGATEDQVEGWLSWHLAIARGEVGAVSDVVPTLTGHAGRPIEAAWGTDEPQSTVR